MSPEEPFVKEVLALEGDHFNDRVISGLSIKTLYVLSKRQTQQDKVLEKLYSLGFTDKDIDSLLEELFPIEEVGNNQAYKSNVIPFPTSPTSSKEKENVKRRKAS